MYQSTNTEAVRRLVDGAFIPYDLGNKDYAEYLEWLSKGNRPQPDQPPAPQQLAAAARAKRDALLTQADYAVHLIEDAGGDPSAWRSYRQALRDITAQSGFPQEIEWPTQPV